MRGSGCPNEEQSASQVRTASAPARSRRLWTRWFGGARASLIGFLLLFGACDGTVPPAAGGSGEIVPLAPSGADELREALDEDFARVWAGWMESEVAPSSLRYLLLDADEPVPLQRHLFLAQRYDAREWAPLFVENGVVNGRGEAVLEVLGRAREHGLDPERYVRPALAEALLRLREVHAAWESRPTPALESEALDHAQDLLDTPEVSGALDPSGALFAALLGDDAAPAPVLDELRRVHATRIAVERAHAGASAIVEALVADAFLAWAFDQRHFNVAHLDNATEEERQTYIAERMTGTFADMEATGGHDDALAVVEALQPMHPQYALLLGARARYQAFVDAGGWEPVPTGALSRGAHGPRVLRLKERLAAEDYFHGTMDESFDAELDTAFREYQETHQFDVDGETSRSFWTSLNMSAEQRLRQIDLTLQRWRESRIGDDPYYVFVNIPDFHAEVWRNGVRDLRFRIVAGNTRRVCNPQTGTWQYANATPLQSATMRYVVLNPYWNVPVRIVGEELLPELLDDETYFQQHGFERFVTPEGSEIIRQRPGPTNPLGQVKFMFPNRWNTYMHDTDKRNFFNYTVRAFSHGCMRVQDPLVLLEYVLRNDGQWEDAHVDRVLEGSEETAISLQTPIPVHIEYYVVRVDDEGRVNFLTDIYRYDRDRLEPPSPTSLRCTPDPTPVYTMGLDENMQVVFRDPSGVIVDPNAISAGSGEGPSDMGP